MHLGDVLTSLDRIDVVELLGERLDLVTLARVRAAADAAGEDLTTYARRAVGQFDRAASEEAWAQVVGRVQNGEPPVAAFLDAMLRHRLDADARASPVV